MPDSFLFDKTYGVLKKSMDISSRRNTLITGNIANVNTIGYQPRDIDFKKTLERELSNTKDDLSYTHGKHIRHGVDSEMSGTVRKDKKGKYDLDSVNIDTEMTTLVENNIQYRTSAELLLRKIAIIRYAITEGGR